EEATLYDGAIETLARLQAKRPPAVLKAQGARWPLLTYDYLALETGVDLFIEWLPALHPAVSFSDEDLYVWEDFWSAVCFTAEREASVFCHRDYHAENLLWLPERTGVRRVGLLDFQDAVLAHPAWDLSMMLHDARRDISRELEAAGLASYFEHTGADREAMMRNYSVLGALNILRILGIFSRLIVRDGKPRYRAFMPRMWGYLDRVLTHPELAPMKAMLEARVPREVRS
ncbi:MAG: phosphotransferase, partial [Alphaproteobacteria bacterium]